MLAGSRAWGGAWWWLSVTCFFEASLRPSRGVPTPCEYPGALPCLASTSGPDHLGQDRQRSARSGERICFLGSLTNRTRSRTTSVHPFSASRAVRQPSLAARLLSVIPEERHREWFSRLVGDRGLDQSHLPFPVSMIERLVRMFSFVGDTGLDPMLGSGTTSVASAVGSK